MPAPSDTCRESTAEMTCPGCAQQFEQPGEQGQCPYCGYPCAAYQRYVTITQVIVGVVFASTLVYGGLVAFLELVVQYRPVSYPTSERIFGGALLLLSFVLLIVSLRFERAGLAKGDAPSLQRGVTMLAALAEVPAMWGLLIYLLFGSMQWLVVGMAISWALFFRLGVRLPVYLHRISQELRTAGKGQ